MGPWPYYCPCFESVQKERTVDSVTTKSHVHSWNINFSGFRMPICYMIFLPDEMLGPFPESVIKQDLSCCHSTQLFATETNIFFCSTGGRKSALPMEQQSHRGFDQTQQQGYTARSPPSIRTEHERPLESGSAEPESKCP